MNPVAVAAERATLTDRSSTRTQPSKKLLADDDKEGAVNDEYHSSAPVASDPLCDDCVDDIIVTAQHIEKNKTNLIQSGENEKALLFTKDQEATKPKFKSSLKLAAQVVADTLETIGSGDEVVKAPQIVRRELGAGSRAEVQPSPSIIADQSKDQQTPTNKKRKGRARGEPQITPLIDISEIPDGDCPPILKIHSHDTFNDHTRARPIKPGASKYMGVYFDKKCSRWKAQIMLGKKVRSLGYYDDELKAAEVYAKVAYKYKSSEKPEANSIYGGLDLSGTPDDLPLITSAKESSGYAGVKANRYGKWEARVTGKDKYVHLGIFPTREAAALIYAKALYRIQKREKKQAPSSSSSSSSLSSNTTRKSKKRVRSPSLSASVSRRKRRDRSQRTHLPPSVSATDDQGEGKRRDSHSYDEDYWNSKSPRSDQRGASRFSRAKIRHRLLANADENDENKAGYGEEDSSPSTDNVEKSVEAKNIVQV